MVFHVCYLDMKHLFFIIAILFTQSLSSSCSKESGAIGTPPEGNNTSGVEIVIFNPASGTYFAGQTATTLLSIKNLYPKDRDFWIGCSVMDITGKWHDITPIKVSSKAGTTSAEIKMDWTVPSLALITSGDYTVRAAVWDRDPSLPSPQRLALVQKDRAFEVFNIFDTFNSIDDKIWKVSNKKSPGIGYFRPANVYTKDGALHIKYPANTKDGGEIYTLPGYTMNGGSVQTFMKSPSSLQGTFSALFLYNYSTMDEIDIELWNDGSNKAEFSVWRGAIKVFGQSTILPFDPSEALHLYRIDISPKQISFYIDNKLYASLTDPLKIPSSSMEVHLNGWWPSWMEGESQNIDKYLIFDWIKF